MLETTTDDGLPKAKEEGQPTSTTTQLTFPTTRYAQVRLARRRNRAVMVARFMLVQMVCASFSQEGWLVAFFLPAIIGTFVMSIIHPSVICALWMGGSRPTRSFFVRTKTAKLTFL